MDFCSLVSLDSARVSRNEAYSKALDASHDSLRFGSFHYPSEPSIYSSSTLHEFYPWKPKVYCVEIEPRIAKQFISISLLNLLPSSSASFAPFASSLGKHWNLKATHRSNPITEREMKKQRSTGRSKQVSISSSPIFCCCCRTADDECFAIFFLLCFLENLNFHYFCSLFFIYSLVCCFICQKEFFTARLLLRFCLSHPTTNRRNSLGIFVIIRYVELLTASIFLVSLGLLLCIVESAVGKPRREPLAIFLFAIHSGLIFSSRSSFL